MLANEEFIRLITERIEEAKHRPAQELQHRHIIVLIAGVRYAIPMRLVAEIVRTPALTPIPGARAYIQGIFFHRGTIIPVIDIPKRFQSGSISLRVPQHIVIIDNQGTTYGFLVDHVVDALECLPEHMKSLHEGGGEHLPSPYLLGLWEQQAATKEPLFRYDFLIAGPAMQQRYQEDKGGKTVPVTTYLLSVPHMVEALEKDSLLSVIQ
jgi:chemotaxis signal transduction protein